MNPTRTIGVAAAAIIALSLTACSTGAQESDADTPAVSGAVALSFPAPSTVAVWNDALDLVRSQVEAAGYEFLTDDPAGNAQTQASDWGTWIQRSDVKAIMGYPAQSDTLLPVTAEATAAGIPVLGWAVPWEGTTASLLSDGEADGKMLGEAAGEWIIDEYGTDEPVPVTIIGYWDNDFGRLRSDGIAEGLEASGANVVLNKVSGLYLEDGNSAVQNALAAQPDTKVWLSFSSEPALGAYQALLDAGVAPDDDSVLFGSLDVSNQSLDILSAPNSIWRLSYATTTQSLADTAADMLISAARGEKVENVVVASEQVTASNAEAFRTSE